MPVWSFLIGKDSANVRGLQEEVAGLQSDLNESKLNRTNRSKAFELSRAATRSARVQLPQPEPELSDGQQFEAFKKEFTKRAVDAWVASTAAERANGYASVLSDLGLEPEAISQVQSNLTELHRKAIAAGDPLGELVLARDKYDKEMRSLLGEENYNRYREYEARKPAVREYDMLTEYASEHGFSLDPAQADQIIGLMKEAGATTTVTWHGPYDPLPRPVAGPQLVEEMQADYTALVESANSLLEAATESGVSDEYYQLLHDYYTDKVLKAYDIWGFANRPSEEVHADIRARMRAIVDEQLKGPP